MRVKVRCERITTDWSGTSQVYFGFVNQHASDLSTYIADPPGGKILLTYRAKTDHGLTAGNYYYVTLPVQAGGGLDLDQVINPSVGDTGVLSVVAARSTAPGPSSGKSVLTAVDNIWGTVGAAWSLTVSSV